MKILLAIVLSLFLLGCATSPGGIGQETNSLEEVEEQEIVSGEDLLFKYKILEAENELLERMVTELENKLSRLQKSSTVVSTLRSIPLNSICVEAAPGKNSKYDFLRPLFFGRNFEEFEKQEELKGQNLTEICKSGGSYGFLTSVASEKEGEFRSKVLIGVISGDYATSVITKVLFPLEYNYSLKGFMNFMGKESLVIEYGDGYSGNGKLLFLETETGRLNEIICKDESMQDTCSVKVFPNTDFLNERYKEDVRRKLKKELEASENWELYDDGEISFRYPADFLAVFPVDRQESVIRKSLTLKHETPFVGGHFCDWSGIGIPGAGIRDFTVSMSLYDGGIETALNSYVREEFFENGKLKLEGNFIEEFSIGDWKGYVIHSGVEGCGSDEYYVELSPIRTLKIYRDYGDTSCMFSEDYRREVYETPGLIKPEDAKDLFEKIMSTLQVKNEK